MNLFSKQWVFIILIPLTLAACKVNSSTSVNEPSQPSSELEELALKKGYNKHFGTIYNDKASSIATNAKGDSLYVGGDTFGDLNGANLGRADAFVRKYNINGRELWTKQFGTSHADFLSGIAAPPTRSRDEEPYAGDIYVAGNTFGSLQGANLGKRDAFVRKYNASGNELWTKQFGTSHYDFLSGITVDANGGVYVAGYTLGRLQGANLGGTDAFVRKYNANGDELWTRQFGTSGNDFINDIKADFTGNVFVVGSTTGGLQGAGVNLGDRDAFVRKYSASGDELWTEQFGTSRNDYARGVITSDSFSRRVPARRVYVVGHTSGNLEGFSNGKADAFIRSYNANDGSVLFTDQFGTSDSDYATGVGVSAVFNDIFVAGNTKRSLQGGVEAFIRKYDSDGNVDLTKQFGSMKNYYIKGVEVHLDKTYVVGRTDGDLQGIGLGLSDAFISRHNDDFLRERLENDASAKQYLKEAVTYQEIYKIDHGTYTTSTSDLTSLGLRHAPVDISFTIVSSTDTGYCMHTIHAYGSGVIFGATVAGGVVRSACAAAG